MDEAASTKPGAEAPDYLDAHLAHGVAAVAHSTANALHWADILDPFMYCAGIVTRLRVAAFLGCVSVESGGFLRTRENLNYSSAERIRFVWPDKFAPTHGMPDAAEYVGRPELLGSYVYANMLGNGPPQTQDGFRFRGAGLLQVTGRAEFTQFARDTGRTLDEAVALLDTDRGAAEIAVWFWEAREISRAADEWDLAEVSRLVAGSNFGSKAHEDACHAALRAL